VRHVIDLRSLDENKWLGFEKKKLKGNFSKLLGIRIRLEKALYCANSKKKKDSSHCLCTRIVRLSLLIATFIVTHSNESHQPRANLGMRVIKNVKKIVFFFSLCIIYIFYNTINIIKKLYHNIYIYHKLNQTHQII
jgi:hypothetical protein